MISISRRFAGGETIHPWRLGRDENCKQPPLHPACKGIDKATAEGIAGGWLHSRLRKVVASKLALECSPEQNVGIKEVAEKIWLVSFMDYDLGFFDYEAGRVECAPNPFGPNLLVGLNGSSKHLTLE